MPTPKILVISGYGLNCEEETAYAFNLAGGEARIVHINDLISGTHKLKNYQILALGGGFAYGDDTGSGRAYANKLVNHLQHELAEFTQKDKLVIGICNGFQITTHTKLLPGTLVHNQSARYLDRWVDLKVANNSPWLKNITNFSIPIAHGEGNYYVSPTELRKLQQNHQIALRYVKGEICTWQNLPANPNGSTDNIAGVTDKSGRILGLMPHPERAMFFTHLPNWTYLKEKYSRAGQSLPQYGPGLQIFRNGVQYFK